MSHHVDGKRQILVSAKIRRASYRVGRTEQASGDNGRDNMDGGSIHH